MAAILLWWVIGSAGFFYWWTTDFTVGIDGFLLGIMAGILGPFSWLVGRCIHGRT